MRSEVVIEDAPQIETSQAEIIVHPAVVEAAAPAPASIEAPAALVPEPGPEPVAAMAEPEPEPINYEPDQERRDKFFSRLSRWSKK